jgi:PAS domain S-box-containing protein
MDQTTEPTIRSGIEAPLTTKQSEKGARMTAAVIPMTVDRSRDEADELAFALPEVLWDLVPAAVYACDLQGTIVRFNRRAAELWGREPKLLDPRERYCGAHRLYYVDGRLLPHSECPMADVLVTGEIVRDQEVMIERPDGSRIIALVNIEPLRDSKGAIIGAINCFQDITERKRSEAQIVTLAREAEHRAKNILATVQATVHLTQADTGEAFKAAVNGRIQALANVHTLFAQSHWIGADLQTLAVQELSPYCQDDQGRARIDGPAIILEPGTAQIVGVCLHELATNAAKYGALSRPHGHVRIAWSRTSEARLVLSWTETGGPPVAPPSRQGFGTRVMKQMVKGQLKGEMRFDWRLEGCACELTFAM